MNWQGCTLVAFMTMFLLVKPVIGSSSISDSLRVEGKNTDEQSILVIPIIDRPASGSYVLANDSTLRWEQWLEFSDFISRKPGAFTYRQGGFRRYDAFILNGYLAHEIGFQQEGMNLVEPVTGRPRLEHIPFNRTGQIYGSDESSRYRIFSDLQRYYIPKPVTRVSFIQGSHDTRSTDAHVALMVDRATGLDLAYQGNNSSGEYLRSSSEGRQFAIRGFRHLDERHIVQVLVQNVRDEHQEPGWYQITNMSDFEFSRFYANPVNPSARSERVGTQMQVALNRRYDSVTNVELQSAIRFWYDRYRRSYYANSDSSAIHWQSINVGATHRLEINRLRVTADADLSWYLPRTIDTSHGEIGFLNYGNWLSSSYNMGAEIDLTRWFTVPVGAQYSLRSDGYSDWGIHGSVRLGIQDQLVVILGVQSGTRMPTMSHLYWSGSVQGNRNLGVSEHQRLYFNVLAGSKDSGFFAELQGYTSTIDNLAVIDHTGMFTSAGKIIRAGGHINLGYESPHWEYSVSSTFFNQTGGEVQHAVNSFSDHGVRLWNRMAVYRKGYVYNNAAFVKAGIHITLSPNSYVSPWYNPSLDQWMEPIEFMTDHDQNSSVNSFNPPYSGIPGFLRIDADLSARVRSMIVSLRWEQLNQGVGQKGYYEAAWLPMPSSHVRFGVKVLFTN